MTKYCAIAFFALVICLGIIENTSTSSSSSSDFRRDFERTSEPRPAALPPKATTTTNPPANTGVPLLPLTISSNSSPAPTPAASNSPAVPAK